MLLRLYLLGYVHHVWLVVILAYRKIGGHTVWILVIFLLWLLAGLPWGLFDLSALLRLIASILDEVRYRLRHPLIGSLLLIVGDDLVKLAVYQLLLLRLVPMDSVTLLLHLYKLLNALKEHVYIARFIVAGALNWLLFLTPVGLSLLRIQRLVLLCACFGWLEFLLFWRLLRVQVQDRFVKNFLWPLFWIWIWMYCALFRNILLNNLVLVKRGVLVSLEPLVLFLDF